MATPASLLKYPDLTLPEWFVPQFDENAFLDLVYGAALEPDLWLAVLGQFAGMTGGWSAFLTRVNLVSGESIEWGTHVDPVLAPLYGQHYAALNPFATPPPRRVNVNGHGSDQVRAAEVWLPKSDLMRTEFYNDYMRPQGIHSAILLQLADRPHAFTQLVVNRRESASAGELVLAARFQPHIQRAFGLAQKLNDLGAMDQDIEAVMEASPQGLFLLDSTGHVRRLNRKAEWLLAHRPEFYLRHGQLSLRASDLARRLDALIAAAGTNDIERRRGGSMNLSAQAGSSPLSITVSPVRSDRAAMVLNGPSVLVCVADFGLQTRMGEADLQLLFGVTAAEARVGLAIVNGASAREVAEKLGLSFHTVRHQIQSLIDKTGVQGKAELTALLARTAAGMSR